MNNILEDCLEKNLGEVVSKWEGSQEYEEAWKDCKEIYGEIKKELPEDKSFSFIDKIDCKINNLEFTCSEYFYKAGIREGVKMFKQIQRFLLDVNEENIELKPAAIKVTELSNEYIEANPSETSNGLREIYIYEKAFEEGKKVAIKEILG